MEENYLKKLLVKALLLYSTTKPQAVITGIDVKIYTEEKKMFNHSLAKMKSVVFVFVF